MTVLVLALCVVQGPIDAGTLVVRADTAEIARESFRLSSARIATGAFGWALATTIRYDRGRPVVVLEPSVEIGPDSVPASLEYTVADPRGPLRILGQLAHGRFTVRLLGRRTERAREFPDTHPMAILDDSVFALYLPLAWQARAQPVEVTAIFARAERREILTIQDRGIEPTTLNRDPASLRHISVTGGASHLVHVWLGAEGRLDKVEIPSRGIAAERAPGP